MLSFSHIAIPTNDLDNSISWYCDYFNCTLQWELTKFSNLTISRIPTINKLVELRTSELRFHIFDLKVPIKYPDEDSLQFHHFCLFVTSPEELLNMRNKWNSLYESGRFEFNKHDSPTEIVIDDNGIESFYFFDPNGLEYELMYIPNK